MRIKYGVVQFNSGEYGAVVFGEAESVEEIRVVPDIRWGDKGIVGDYCSPCGSHVLFINPCQDEEDAKQWAGSVAVHIDDVVENEIKMKELRELARNDP